MKLGFGLYYHMLNDNYFSFARQCGATHVTIHLTDYFYQGPHNTTAKNDNQPVGTKSGWGIAGSNPHVWEYEYLLSVKKHLAEHGLVWEAIENFDPADWYAILLDLPKKKKQLERLKQIIKNIGKVGVPFMGYNFSLAGVSSRINKRAARGGAVSVVMEEVDETPIPNGMIWNMVYDQTAMNTGYVPSITPQELWQRLEWFLTQIIPIAEENNVRLAAHPDDPPTERVKQQPRLVNNPELYQKLLDIVPSDFNTLELCLGTLQEMPATDKDGKDLAYWVDMYARQNAIGYVHFRNVKGKVPTYQETFVDEGDINMRKIIEVLRNNHFNGMLIPDHTPQMECDAPWHAGMAYAMGYMKALLEM